MSKDVKALGDGMFDNYSQLREVVFEPDSRLERIENNCFTRCALRDIVIPKNVRSIEAHAFYECKQLSSLNFEKGNRLS